MSDRNYADWLNAQFSVHKDKSKANLARALGLEPPAVSKILNGTRQIKAHEYNIMRQFFGLPIDGERAVMLSRRQETAGFSLSGLSEQGGQTGDQWVIPSEFQAVPSDHKQGSSLQNFTVSDHFMEPDFARDSSILVDLSDRLPSPAGVFVVSDKFSEMVRHCRIVPRSQPVEIEITASNLSFQAQVLKLDDFEIMGRVLAKLDWV